MKDFIINKLRDATPETTSPLGLVTRARPALFEKISLVKALKEDGSEMLVRGLTRQMTIHNIDQEIIDAESKLASLKVVRADMMLKLNNQGE